MAYSTIKEVTQTGGFYKGVYDAEAVGTGDTTNKVFTLDFNPVCEGSEKIYVNGDLKTVTTDYTMNYTTGVITFVAAPAVVAVTATYWYYTITIDSEVITDFIAESDAWVDEFTGQAWESTAVADEKYDPNKQTWLYLESYPTLTVTALTIDGTAITTTEVYIYGEEGKIVLSKDAEATTFTSTDPQGIVISYTHGAASTPETIKGLARRIAAIKSLVSLMGGTYDDVTGWTIGSMSASVGEPYVNMLRTVEKLDKEVKFMLKNIRKLPVVIA